MRFRDAAKRLKIRDFILLNAIAQQGSLIRAAAEMNLTQSAVSKAVREIEQIVGVTLIHRDRSGAELTAYGQALNDRGRAVLDELRQAAVEIDHIADPHTGEVRIGTSEPIAAGFLPVVLSQFIRSHPRVSVFVSQAVVGNLQVYRPQYQDLRERNVDLIIGPIVRPALGTDLQAEHLFSEQLLVAAGTSTCMTKKRRMKLADIASEQWCLPALDTPVGRRCASAFEAVGLEYPRKTINCISVHLQIALLVASRIYTMLPSSLVVFSGKRLRIGKLPVTLNAPPLPIGVVTLRSRALNPAAAAFVDSLRQHKFLRTLGPRPRAAI